MTMRLLSCLLAISCSGFVHAEKAPEKISASFYCFRYAPDLEDVYVRIGAESYKKIELSTANIIGPLSVVNAEGNVTIHRMDTDDKGMVVYPLVGKAKIGTNSKPLLVMFPNAKDEALAYRCLTLDRNQQKFPLGSFQFINLSTYALRGMVGKTRIDVKAGGVKLLKPQGKPGEMLQVTFQYNDGKIWRTMTKTRWALRRDRRSLLCAYFDPRDKRLKMRSIPERIAPPTETSGSSE